MVARILVAEDQARSLVLMLHLLKGRGYSTAFATDGAEALRMALEERPDLIVCQWRLSNPDGSEASRRFGEEEPLRSIPVLALFDGPRAEPAGRTTPAGCVDHVVKPIDPDAFIRTVERHIPPALRATRLLVRPRGRRRRNDPL